MAEQHGIIGGLPPSRIRIAQLAGNARRVLDIGCADGYIGEYLRETYRTEYLAGIELDAGSARQARECYDMVVEGDAEDGDVWGKLPREFDAVIAADVLEHLRRPEKVLEKIGHQLAAQGSLIVSLPNVAYWEVRRDLFFRGRWEYTDWGILDRTHLRFYTRQSAERMLRDAGYRIMTVEPVYTAFTGSRWRLLPFFDRLKRRSELFASQFIFCCSR
jgi:O-antigen biosynthesis protein